MALLFSIPQPGLESGPIAESAESTFLSVPAKLKDALKHNPTAKLSVKTVFLTFMYSCHLLEFLQGRSGISLTGSIKEQVMFVLYGSGKNL
jgi:hypothetical protein